jgi:hypothetical protein
MAAEAGTPYFLWGDAILHSVEMTNDLPCAGNPDFASPNFMATGSKPEFKIMMPWGCFACIARPAGLLTDKHMGMRAIPGIYVGSALRKGRKGITIWCPTDRRYYTGECITHNPQWLPYKNPTSNSNFSFPQPLPTELHENLEDRDFRISDALEDPYAQHKPTYAIDLPPGVLPLGVLPPTLPFAAPNAAPIPGLAPVHVPITAPISFSQAPLAPTFNSPASTSGSTRPNSIAVTPTLPLFHAPPFSVTPPPGVPTPPFTNTLNNAFRYAPSPPRPMTLHDQVLAGTLGHMHALPPHNPVSRQLQMGMPPIPEHSTRPLVIPSPNILRDTRSSDPTVTPNALLAMQHIAAKQAQERAYYNITPIAYDRHHSRYVPLGAHTTVSTIQQRLAETLASHTTPEIEICPMTYYSTIANQQASHYRRCTSDTNTYIPTPIKFEEPIPSFSTAELREMKVRIPRNDKQAELLPEWKFYNAARIKEYNGIVNKGTFSIVPIPVGSKIIPTRFIYDLKLDENWGLEKFKGRLIVQGFHQVKGIDYDDSFAPVPHPTGCRVINAIANELGLPIYHIDVSQAYLHASMAGEKPVYVSPPKGFELPPGMCLRLEKALYGTPIAGRAWFKELRGFLGTLGFAAAGFEGSIYTLYRPDGWIILYVHVDDILILSNKNALANWLKNKVMTKYPCTEKGELKYYVGVQFERDYAKGTTLMHQQKFTQDLLHRFGMQDCTPTLTPMIPGTRLTAADCPETPDLERGERYRSMCGGATYLVTQTRPDAGFVHSELSRFQHNPGQVHMDAMIYFYRYLKGTSDLGLMYRKSSNGFNLKAFGADVAKPTNGSNTKHNGFDLNAYGDSDWGANPDNSRSTLGWQCFLGMCLISWKSKCQKTVAMSSSEAEYMAASNLCKEIIYLRMFLEQLGHKQFKPTVIHEDNNACIAMTLNPVARERSKHIRMHRNYIREKVESGICTLMYCSTADQLADGLTKAQLFPIFYRHRTAYMGMEPSYWPKTRGGGKGTFSNVSPR